jgi:2-polyprenyl-6-methoxyphenol hydroxylase-like FAD-dependent oxidoreductase
LELLDARGLADRLVDQGVRVPRVQPLPGASLDLTTIPSRYPMLLIVPQSGTERLLEERARELGVEIVRGAEVTGLTQDADGVRLEVEDATGRQTVHARYAVGADGAHSAIRRLLGVDFVGERYQTHIMLADVMLARPPAEFLFGRNNAEGLVVVVPYGDGWFRVIVWDRARDKVPLDEPVTLPELKDAFRRIAGDDYGMGEPRWRSRFLSERKQARTYRVGSVFLAGDAAHVHSPVGGQGMNTGIQDAMNLGWKLAAGLRGWAPPDLLDTYQAERHPVGAAVLALTDGLNRLVLSSSRAGAALRAMVIRGALSLGPVRRRLADRISGVGIGYDRPAGAHRWVGRRLPDTEGDGHRVYELLRQGRFVLADRADGAAATAAAAWPDRVVTVSMAPDAAMPPVMLIRPDGYVAWASDRPSGAEEVRQALRQWCGPMPSAEQLV